VEAVTDDRGQALVFSVLLLGVAAAALVGLRDAQDRILDAVRDERAGEAAVTAAGEAVADLQHAKGDLDRQGTAAFVTRSDVIDAARAAAIRLARLHGRPDPTEVSVVAYGYEIEVHLTLGGRQHIALLEPPP
jgi:hypothetical protein